MSASTIAIHKTADINNIDTTDETMPIIRFASIEEFNTDFQHIHENGDLYGVFQDEAGNIVALDNEFTRHENVLL
jgi:hypothetical protein